jgi:hypothetical protein
MRSHQDILQSALSALTRGFSGLGLCGLEHPQHLARLNPFNDDDMFLFPFV